MELRYLGTLEASLNGRHIDLGEPQQRLLLAILLSHSGQVVSTDRLIDDIWGDASPRSARKIVQRYVSGLRKALGSTGAIESQSPGYRLNPDSADIDADQFERLVREATGTLELADPGARRLLHEALDLWRGKPFEDLADYDALRLEITRLELLRDAALQSRIEADIYAGESATVLAELADLTARFPLQEGLWALRMLALYRIGRQAEALRTYEEARKVLAESVGLELSNQMRLLEQRIIDQDAILDTSYAMSPSGAPAATPEPRRNPYKGLRAFSEADEGDFYGREDVVRRLHAMFDRRRGPRLVVLAGPSGCGKSSIARAGLVPVLRRSGWEVDIMYPGPQPVAAIDASAENLRNDQDSLVLIDQFEEAFSLVDSDTVRADFLERLADLVADPGAPRMLITIRADFLDRLLGHTRLARHIEEGLVLVPPLEDHEVRDIIIRPAAQVGVAVHPDLVAAAVVDVANRPAALPLLEYALTDLYTRASSGTLTLDAYTSVGGISGSLVKRAEEVYSSFGAGSAATTRRVFVRLVTLTEQGEPLRRRVTSDSLTGLDEAERVLDAFADHRLLTFDRGKDGSPTIEVAHEALLTQWPRAVGWIEGARDSIRLHNLLASAVSEWNEHNRSDQYLLSGARLARFGEDQLGDIGLTEDEQEFLDKSKRVENRHRRQRVAVGWAAVSVFAVLAAVAFIQGQSAQREARHATIRQLAGQSTLSLDEDPERSILLALEAVDLSVRSGEEPLPEAIGSLHQAVQASRLDLRIADGVGSIAVSQDGSLLATDSFNADTQWPTNEVVIWDAHTGTRLRTLSGPSQVSIAEIRINGGGGRALAFSPNADMLAVAYQEEPGTQAPVILWDPTTGAEIDRFVTPGTVAWNPTWIADGTRLAVASWDGVADTLTVWDPASGEIISSFESGFIGEFGSWGDDAVAVTHGPEERVGFYDIGTGAEVDVLSTPGFRPTLIATDRETGRIAIAGRHESLQVWNVGLSTLVWSRPISSSRSVVIDPAGEVVALAGDEGLVRLLRLDDGTETTTLAGHSAGVWGTAFQPDSTHLWSVGTDGESRRWNVDPAGARELEAIQITSGDPFILDVSPDGTEIAASTWNGTFELHDAYGTGLISHVQDLVSAPGVHPVVNGSWSFVAFVDTRDGAGVYRLDNLGDRVHGLPPCSNPRALNQGATAVVVDALWLCSNSVDRSRVIDLTTGTELLDLGHRLIFRAVFNPEGAFEADRYLAVNIDTGGLEIHDMDTEELVFSYEILSTMIRFDPTGRYLAVGTLDGRTIVVDLKRVVDGSSGADALIFDAAVASGGVPGIAITADGVLATAAFDSSFVRLWDVHSGRLIAELRTDLDGSSPPQLNFSPDGGYLLYPDANRILRKYFLDPDRLIRLAEARVTRELTDDECARYLQKEVCDE